MWKLSHREPCGLSVSTLRGFGGDVILAMRVIIESGALHGNILGEHRINVGFILLVPEISKLDRL